MSSSTHQIAVKGVDKTGAAFQSIQARAVAAGRRISSVMGGAIAAAGAYLSIRSIKAGIDELGTLSDLAMKAGTSVDTLTKSALAFQVAGLNLPVETLAKSFQYLKKNTGEGGMDNFYKVAESIAKIEDPAQRGAALVKNFGRAGMELMPLIDGGEEAIQKMKTLTEIMPGVSQAAADAGDEAADSLAILGKGVHNLFLKVVGNIVGMWAKDFPGGIRAGALNAINWLEWFAKAAKATISLIGAKIGAFGGLIFDGFVPALKLMGASLVKQFTVVKDTLTYVGTSIMSVAALAADAITKGPAAAWENFKGTMAEATKDYWGKVKDTSAFDGPMAEIKQAFSVFSGTLDAADKDFQSTMASADAQRKDYVDKLKTLDVSDLANALGGKGAKAIGEAVGTAAAKASTKITNQLIAGGSNDARKLGMLGPQYNEAKKQTEYLKKIADNTAKTAENTDEDGLAVTDLE